MRTGFTRNPRLIKRRAEIALTLKREGFYLNEIGLIIGLKAPAVSKIIKKAEHNKPKKKHYDGSAKKRSGSCVRKELRTIRHSSNLE